MDTRWLAKASGVILVIIIIVALALYTPHDIRIFISLFPGVIILTLVTLLVLGVLSYKRIIWPPSPPHNPGTPEVYNQWAAECSAAGVRATTLALFLAVVGGTLAWSSLQATLLPLQDVPVPEEVKAEGEVEIVESNLTQSSLAIRIKAIGEGRARIVGFAIYIQMKDETERLLFDFSLPSPRELAKDSPIPITAAQMQHIFGAKLHNSIKEPKQLEYIKIEPRYTDILKRPKTPGFKRYQIDITRREKQ